jgi:hypothetical protein
MAGKLGYAPGDPFLAYTLSGGASYAPRPFVVLFFTTHIRQTADEFAARVAALVIPHDPPGAIDPAPNAGSTSY